jgi:hypothetical protein
MDIRINTKRDQLETVQLALRFYSRDISERTTRLEEVEFYRYYILTKVFVIVQKKILSMIDNRKRTGKLKLTRVQCVALQNGITTSPNPNFFSESQAIALNNFLLELGKSVPSFITPEMV